MDKRSLNKAIGYALGVIVLYHIVGIFMPMLIWGLGGLLIYRIFLEDHKHRK